MQKQLRMMVRMTEMVRTMGTVTLTLMLMLMLMLTTMVMAKGKLMPLRRKMRAETQVVTTRTRRQKASPLKVSKLQTRVTAYLTSQQMSTYQNLI